MVEQAVQTGSLDNLNAKKLLPGKGTVGVQLNGRPAPPSSKTASGTETPGPLGRAPCPQLFQMIAPPSQHHPLLQAAPRFCLWLLPPQTCASLFLLRFRRSSAGCCADSGAGE